MCLCGKCARVSAWVMLHTRNVSDSPEAVFLCVVCTCVHACVRFRMHKQSVSNSPESQAIATVGRFLRDTDADSVTMRRRLSEAGLVVAGDRSAAALASHNLLLGGDETDPAFVTALLLQVFSTHPLPSISLSLSLSCALACAYVHVRACVQNPLCTGSGALLAGCRGGRHTLAVLFVT